jgi:hypothetical protein
LFAGIIMIVAHSGKRYRPVRSGVGALIATNG